MDSPEQQDDRNDEKRGSAGSSGKKAVKAPTAEQTVEWLERKQPRFVYRDRGHHYRFHLEGRVLQVEERNDSKVFRKSTVKLERLRDVVVSDFDADGLSVSTLRLSGGSRCTTKMLGDRYKTDRTVEIWLDRDPKLASRLARAFAHLGKLARKEVAEATGEPPRRSIRIFKESNTLSGTMPPSIAEHPDLRTQFLTDMTMFAQGGATISITPPEEE